MVYLHNISRVMGNFPSKHGTFVICIYRIFHSPEIITNALGSQQIDPLRWTQLIAISLS